VVVFGAIGAAASGTTSCTPGYPTGISASTSVLYALVTGRCSIADTAVAAPSGWSLIGALEDGTGTYGTDTGTRRVSWFKKDTVTGSESGTVTFAYGAGANTSTISGTILRLDKTVGTTVTEQFASGADNANGTSFSAITGSLEWATNDLLCIGVAQNIDSGTQSAVNISASGVTFGTLSNRVSVAVTNGADHRRILDTVQVTSGGTTSAATYSYTISAAGSGPVGLILVRETGTPVTVGLNGEGITSGSGEVEPPPSRGQALAFAQETIATIGLTLALVGSAITASTGTVIGSGESGGEVTLSGQGIASASGSLVQSASVPAVGSEVTSAAGSVVQSHTLPALTGEVLTTGTGTVTASGNSVTVNITGAEFDAVPGSVSSGDTLITGNAATSATGSTALGVDIPLTGSEMASATGTISPEQDAVDTYIASASGQAGASADVALTGSEVASTAGDVAPSGDAEFVLTGQASTVSAGSVVFDKQFQLVGEAITAFQGAFGAPGFAALSGAQIDISAGFVFLDNDRTFALTGQSVSVLEGAAVTSYLAFVTGQVLTLTQQAEFGPRVVALSGQQIGAVAGDIHAPGRSGQTPAGKPRRRKKTEVEIDGQIYHVETKEDAARLLETAKQAAEELAALAIERASKAERRPTRKVLADARKALQVPVIDADEDLQSEVEALQQEIADIYTQALQTVEIAALMRKAEIEEDDEDVLLLLS
jgi:gas vesicle protein